MAKKEKLEDCKLKRKELAEQKKANKEVYVDHRDEFRKFFAKVNLKLKLSKEMEDILWKHFIAYGFDKKDKFSDGIKHFGY